MLSVTEGEVGFVAAGEGGTVGVFLELGVGALQPEQQQVAGADPAAAELGVALGQAPGHVMGGVVLTQHLVHGLS